MSREITVDWPWPGEWESVEDVSAFYKDRLYPALSDYIGGIAESDTYIDHVVGPFTIGNLTKGSVLFAGTNGVVSQDNDDLFWDATNIRLGINVGTSPSVPLDVGGDCKFDGAVTINDAGADKDTRIEGLNKTHLLFVDASADFVAINDSAPVCRFQITGTACADYAGVGADTMFLVENNDNVAIHLQAATTGVAFIEFCDDNYNPPAGRVGYDFANAQMEFVVETNEHMWLTTTQLKTDLSNFELSGAGAQIKFTGTTGGGDEGILYKDSGGLARYGLLFEATNKVVLCNRTANGTVELRANTSTAGSGGEITVVTIEDDNVTFGQTFTGITGSTIGNLTLADGSITDSSNAIDFGNAALSTTGTLGAGNTTLAHLALGGSSINADYGVDYEETLTDTDNSEKVGGRFKLSVAKTAADMTSTATGLQNWSILAASNTQDWTAVPIGLHGLQGVVMSYPGSSGTVTGMAALATYAYISGTGANITNLYGLYVQSPSVAGAKLTNYYGIYVGNVHTGATLNYAIYTNTGQIYFGDNIGIGQITFGTNATKTQAFSTGVAPTTSPADAFQMYSADIGAVAGKAGVHFRDEEGNVVSIGSGGVLMSGTARVTKCFQFANAALGKGATKPDEVIVGNYWGWSYDIDDDSVLTVKLPDDWASGTDVLIYIRWAINEAYVTNSGEVRWQATWLAVPANATEAINDAGTTDNSGDINIPTTAYHLTQTLVETIPHASLAAGDELGITIKRVDIGGGADPVADPVITCVGLVYTADKLGLPT